MRDRQGLRATTGAVAFSSLVASAALGVTAIVIARALGPEGRGVFAASYSLLYVFIIVGSLGIGPSGRRLLALGPMGGGVSLKEYNVVVWALVLGQIVLATVGAIVLLRHFGAGRSAGEQVAFVACSVATLAMFLSREALFGVGGARRAELILAAASLATLGAVLLLASLGRMSVANCLWIYAAAAVASCVALMQNSTKRIGEAATLIRPGTVRIVLTSGRPVLVLLVAQAIATRGDRLVIGAIEGPGELGQYAVAVSVMELLSIGALALSNVAFQGLASGRLPDRAMTRARRLTVAATAVAAVGLAVLAPWLIRTGFGSRFDAAVPPLRVLALAAIPYGSYQIDTQHLIARARAGAAAALAVGSAVAMVIADIIVVPIRGILGAAWVSVGVFAAFAILARIAVLRFGRSDPATVDSPLA